MALSGARTRLRSLSPQRLDALTAALFVVAAWIDSLLITARLGSDAPPLGVALVCATVAGAGLGLRRRAPWAMVIVVFGALGAGEFAVGYLADTSVAFVMILWVFYSLGRWVSPLPAITAVSLVAGLLVLGLATEPGQALSGAPLFLAPLFGGRSVRHRAELNRRLREAVTRIESGRLARSENAVEEERERIAGELQSVVAGGVSVIVAQSEAVPRLIAAGDTASAQASLAVIEETGRDALSEMRRLLGVLRRDGEGADRRPLPSLSAVPGLIDAARSRGLTVELETLGSSAAASSGVELAAYRVIERGIAVAEQAGASRVEVTLSHGDRDLGIELVDDRPRGAESGDLAALRERVQIYDGNLRAGPAAGGHELRARLPLGVVR